MMGEKGKGYKKIIESFQKYGYTQRQMAARLNLHFSTISDLMREVVTPQ
jgi:transcriptional regulator with XRE-family HTH domain